MFFSSVAKQWHITFIYIFVLLIFVSSCRTLKPVKPPVVPDQTIDQHLDFKTAKALSNYLKQNEFSYDWLTSRFSANVDMDANKQSFNVSVRAKKDSAIWLSVSLLGIEGARMLITTDSLKFIDRVNNKYFIGDYNYLSQRIHIDLDFEMLQSVLIGNSVEFYDEDEKLKSAKDSTYYLLSTIRKRKLKKVLNKSNEGIPVNELVQRIWLNPLTFKIEKILINDFSLNRTFTADYSDFQVVDSSYFPFKAQFDIDAQKKIKMNIDYSKVVRDKPQSMPFNIPSKYERIE